MNIYNNKSKEIPSITAANKKNYMCVEANTSFTIVLENLSQYQTVYAPKLFIDGQEVAGFKTLSKYCNYHGFKLGGGKYKQFLFSEPPVAKELIVS